MALLLIILGLGTMCLISIFPISGRTMGRSCQKFFFIELAFIMSAISIYIIPQKNMDLFRYYNTYLQYRRGGYDYLITQLSSDVQWVYCVVMYIISKIGIKELLPFLSCIICFIALYYIWFDYMQYASNKKIGFFTCWGLFFVWLPYFQIIDNLRNPVSASICAVCIYNQFYKMKPLSKQIVLYVFACMIHTQSALIFLIVILISKFPHLYKFRYMLLAIPILQSVILYILSLIPLTYVRFLYLKAVVYFSEEYNSILYNEFTISRFAICLFFLLADHFFLKKKYLEEEKILQLIEILMLFVIGSFRIVEIVRRIPYVIAFLAPIQLGAIKKCTHGNLNLINVGVWGMILAMQFYAMMKLTRFGIEGINYEWFFNFLGIS